MALSPSPCHGSTGELVTGSLSASKRESLSPHRGLVSFLTRGSFASYGSLVGLIIFRGFSASCCLQLWSRCLPLPRPCAVTLSRGSKPHPSGTAALSPLLSKTSGKTLPCPCQLLGTYGLAEVIGSRWASPELPWCDSWICRGCYRTCPVLVGKVGREQSTQIACF